MSGPEASHDARWDCAALNIINQIWQIPAEWPETRRKAHAQILIIEALKAADTIPRRALEEISAMDPKGIRADDLGRAARIASAGLTHD